VWVITEIIPTIPRANYIINYEEVNKFSNQFNAIPAFADIILTCASSEENEEPKCGEGYFAHFTGFKEI
jgi:hypothetical protein